MTTTPEITERILFLSGLSHGGKLKELLATIHRDGGHFANEHGLATAVAVAEQKWYELAAQAAAKGAA